MNWYVMEALAREIERERHQEADRRRVATLAVRAAAPAAPHRPHRLIVHGGPFTMVLTVRRAG